MCIQAVCVQRLPPSSCFFVNENIVSHVDMYQPVWIVHDSFMQPIITFTYLNRHFHKPSFFDHFTPGLELRLLVYKSLMH